MVIALTMNAHGTINGCSLENCHTNLFALTDLKTIKWKKLTVEGSSSVDPLDDPVLRSFSQCIQADVLSAWRKTAKSQSEKHVDDLSCRKELWVFWYGDEPANLASLLSPGLKVVDRGSFETCMSYECRTLLFRALHTLIERCLVSQGYVRVGRWFVQPFEHSLSQYRSKKLHLSFQFSFFLHGESNVCASIDVRQHPPLYRVGGAHLAQMARLGSVDMPVILAPYGLSASLTGAVARDVEQVKRLLNEWRQFYVIRGTDVEWEDVDGQRLPPTVEVVVGGVKMRYPTSLVLVEGDDFIGRPAAVPVDSTREAAMQGTAAVCSSCAGSSGKTSSAGSRVLAAMQHVQRALEDSATSATPGPSDSTDVSNTNMWLFSDNAKSTCSCSKTKQHKEKSSLPVSGVRSVTSVVPPGKHQKLDKASSEKADRTLANVSCSIFHKRIADNAERNGLSLPQLGSEGRGGTSQKVEGGHLQDCSSGGVATKESPSLGAPSPLTDSQLPSSFSGDLMMPTLSPHPPLSKYHDKDSSAHGSSDVASSLSSLTSSSLERQQQATRARLHGEQATVTSTSSSHTTKAQIGGAMPSTSLGLLLSSPSAKYMPGHIATSTAGASKLSPVKATASLLVRHTTDVQSLKRPLLAAASYEDDDEDYVPLTAIYDLDSACLSGAKRGRNEDNSLTCDAAGSSRSGDPYEFADGHSQPLGGQEQSLFSPGANRDGASRRSAEAQQRGAAVKTNVPGQAGVNTSLIREQDLKPTMNDLDNLFASDSEGSDSDMPPTPPKSNRPDKSRSQASLGVMISQVDIIYPTPPSMEPHMNDQSPHQRAETEMLTDDNFKDTVNVFKPPQTAAFMMPLNYLPHPLKHSDSSVVSVTYQPSFHLIHHQQAAARPPATIGFNSGGVGQNLSQMGGIMSRTSTGVLDAAKSFSSTASSHIGQLMRTPSACDLPSPASNASSYLNRTLSSVDNQPTTNIQCHEANSAVANILLSDTVLNLFKDSNFDSCPMCVCNGTILGVDNGVYLPDRSKEDPYKCSCGFSAVVNRKYGIHSGLFWEDEYDISGKRPLPPTKKPSLFALAGLDGDSSKSLPPSGDIPDLLLLQLQAQFSCLVPTALLDYAFNGKRRKNAVDSSGDVSSGGREVNSLDMSDGCEACWPALEAALQATNGQGVRPDKSSELPLHKWPYLQGTSTKLVASSGEVVRLLKSLQPLLQDALQKKRSTRLWDAVYKVDGPLNWKDFHRLAGRGLEETSKPQPIPRLLFGMERDWVSMSPFVMKHWDRFLLEPYGDRRNVLYVIVAPDSESVLARLITFFKDLSTVYETSHLGRHRPISAKLRDGILRVGAKSAAKVATETVDAWFTAIGNHHLANRLKTYAQICRYHLAPFVAQEMSAQNLEASAVKPPPPVTIKQETPAHNEVITGLLGSSAPGSHHWQAPQASSQSSHDDKSALSGDILHELAKEQSHESEVDESSREQPAIVVYMVDPFDFGNEASSHRRLATFGLLQCFNEFVDSLPKALRPSVHLQVLPLQLIYQHDLCPDMNYLRSLALSVYTQACRVLTHSPTVRPLTCNSAMAIVPPAEASQAVKESMVRLLCPPYVLASEREAYCAVSDIMADRSDHSAVLFCTYCLSADQQWLLAACTDHRGELFDTVTINIGVPDGHLRKKASARRVGLRRLWEFVIGVLSCTTTMWRIVIGRFGRLGHGELKGWAGLLSRTNLQRSSHVLHATCTACRQASGGAVRGGQRGSRDTTSCTVCGLTIGPEVPHIVSACLVSLELHPSIHVMTDSVNNADAFGTTTEDLSTPRDASCTHILVFPTSATAQPNASNDQRGPADADLADETFLPTLDDDELGDLGGDLNDFFGGMYDAEEADKQQGRMSPGTQGLQGSGGAGGAQGGSSSSNGLDSLSGAQDEMGNLSLQPLAIGYYVSTAQTGPLPHWFRSGCLHKENACPTCFKAALHIHTTVMQADYAIVQPSGNVAAQSHPLDSSLTCDVLRYVLETYNALSWLTVDVATNDRRSCLPPHMVVLMQLYHAMDQFV